MNRSQLLPYLLYAILLIKFVKGQKRMRLTDRRLAQIIGISPRAILDMKKNYPHRYRLLRLGVLCEDIGLDEADLVSLLEHKNAIRPLFEIIKKVAGK